MIFTSEQVSNGHPDKIADQISDCIVTECLRQDRTSRIAIETLIKDFDIVLAGELTTNAKLNYKDLVHSVLKRIGLDDLDSYNIQELISEQSPDIAQGVDTGGAGDQGIMFGYATNETPEFLPLPYMLATRGLKLLRARNFDFLKPDAKAQVSFDYDKHRIDTFLISTQHIEEVKDEEVHRVVKEVMQQVAKEYNLNTDFKVLINPTGKFVIGTSFGDSGLTGRKIIADTYGGAARHGGGAFSGKDPSKVDRSGAYMMRKIAKDIVRKGFADEIELQVSYAIGVAEPVSVNFNTYGKQKVDDVIILKFISENYDLTPKGMTEQLGLLDVDYNKVSAYGHFTDQTVPWEV